MDKRVYGMKFGVARSIRYHEKRREFFVNVAIALLIASIGVVVANGYLDMGWFETDFQQAMWACLPGTAFLSWIWSRTYNDLRKRFSDLGASLEGYNGGVDDYRFALLSKDRQSIEADEPVVLRLLDLRCHFETMLALGHDMSNAPKFSWVRRVTSHFLSQSEYADRIGREYIPQLIDVSEAIPCNHIVKE